MTDPCRCGHEADDHMFGEEGDWRGECDILGCECPSFLGDGLPEDVDRDRDDRQHVHAAGCDHDRPEFRDA